MHALPSILALLLALSAPPALAEGPRSPASAPPRPAASEPNRQERPRPPSPPAPADTFVPTEKVRADSAIAFPVDI